MISQICIVIKGPTIEKAIKQLEIASRTCSLVELRLDYFEEIDLESIRNLLQQFPIPMIFTLRSTSQGGNYRGSEDKRLEKIKELATLKPEYLDLEYDNPLTFKDLKIIRSYHDFEKMPSLDETLQKMTNGDIYKMAFMLHSNEEALVLLQFMKDHRNVLAMGMGPYGETTRILAPLFGAKFVYASIDPETSTAPGQVNVEELSKIYHFQDLNEATKIFGLIGKPVDKSLGHLAHNAVMHHLNSVYLKFQVPENHLKGFMAQVKRANFGGLSVTMPLKELIIPYLDEIDPWAKKVGAVNTLVFVKGKIKGYNTDGKGALDAIEAKIKVRGKKLLFIGAGGASKAIIAEAIARGAQVTLLNRDAQKALELSEKMGCSGGSLEQISEEYEKGYDLLINATSVPDPIDSKWILPNSGVMDINTRNIDTPFLLNAKEKNCSIIYGYEMFIAQAVEQIELWFGKSDGIKEIIQKAVLRAIYG